MKFAALINYGPDMSKIAEIRPTHRKYLADLLAAGKLGISGPFVDDSGALIVYETETEEEADKLLREDPFSKAGVFASWTFKPWNIVFAHGGLLPLVPPPADPGIVMGEVMIYQRTEALNAALNLEIFTHVAAGVNTAAALAAKIGAAERGVRILCDFLAISGMLTKQGNTYGLGATANVFLDKSKPSYMGGIANFLLHPYHRGGFANLTQIVRDGGYVSRSQDSVYDEGFWVDFAQHMAPITGTVAGIAARELAGLAPKKVLDISAGHGMFGIELAKAVSGAEIVALDSPAVLAVAKENAVKFGVGDRYTLRPGSAFEVDLGSGYDLILVPNFLHHFDTDMCVGFLKKAKAALKPGGTVAIVEFVPNPDRVTPPMAAGFALTMLAQTAAGDAYTFDELASMLTSAGFRDAKLTELKPSPQR